MAHITRQRVRRVYGGGLNALFQREETAWIDVPASPEVVLSRPDPYHLYGDARYSDAAPSSRPYLNWLVSGALGTISSTSSDEALEYGVVAPGVALPAYLSDNKSRQRRPSWYHGPPKNEDKTSSMNKPHHNILTSTSSSKRSDKFDIQKFFGDRLDSPKEGPAPSPTPRRDSLEERRRSYSAGHLTCDAQPTRTPSFTIHGWMEHSLPNNVVYYANEKMRVVTDMNLRHAQTLDCINQYVQELDIDEEATSWELWLYCPDMVEGSDFTPEHMWVNHQDRIVSPIGPKIWKRYGSYTTDDAPVDQIEFESRLQYWKFIEDHPAHCTLSERAEVEAINMLTWSSADGIISPGSTTPFDKHESQELLNLLLSLQRASSDTPGIYARTRLIAHVLLRSVAWRHQNLDSSAILGKRSTHGRSTTKPTDHNTIHQALLTIIGLVTSPLWDFDRSNRVVLIATSMSTIYFLSIALPRTLGFAAGLLISFCLLLLVICTRLSKLRST
ncbi:hypothetical protein K474DRAFT_1705688 [Panus rudis PR-1116 ss-1]|nr:hypothetical protein K474DRAFT_1705688 [Panus rudis PR-1116 ss-1]